MADTNGLNIDLDVLMERIRTEVSQNQVRSNHQQNTNRQQPHSSSFSDGTVPDLLYINPFSESQTFVFTKDGYRIDDFLQFHDKDFLNNAYLAVLKRQPDLEGYNYYLRNLRQGMMTKPEILGRLRYSSEGKAKSVRIKGLWWMFLIQTSFRIPILGYLSRLATGLLKLPVLIANFQKLEAHTQAQFSSLVSHMDAANNKSTSRINALMEHEHSIEAQNRVSTGELEQLKANKADRNELELLRIDLVNWVERESLAAKVDRSELEALAASKAARSELEALAKEKATKQEAHFHQEIKAIHQQIKDHKLCILDQQRRLKMLLEEVRKRLPAPLNTEQIQNILTEQDHLLDAMYVFFEDRFRGTREDIKTRLTVYLPYIEAVQLEAQKASVLDVGCGRGEWLELLIENGYSAKGVDRNKIMIHQCREFGFDVTEMDLLEFLEGQGPNSYEVITGFHIIEHLPFDVLVKLFDESIRILKPGGMAIFESPNPENLLVGACLFYSDATHTRPLVPDSIQFLAEQRGFIRTEIKRLHKYSDELYSETDDPFKNKWFYSEMDFAVIGYKA